MTITTNDAASQTAQSASIRWERLAGMGAIAFAAVVAATNAVVPQPPAWDATGAEVATWVSDNHAALAASVAPFPITSLCLMLFVAGFVRRVRRSGNTDARFFSHIGALGALLIVAMFSVVVVCRLTLLAMDGSPAMTPELVELVWHIEAAAFTLNVGLIGIAVFGVGGAAARIGLAPKWYKHLSIVGLALGIIAATPSSAVVNGADGWQIGFVPFLSWLLLLVTVGVRMVREPAS